MTLDHGDTAHGGNSRVTGLLGVFLLLLWAAGARHRALAWWGAAYRRRLRVALWDARCSAPLARQLPNAFCSSLRHDLERRAPCFTAAQCCPGDVCRRRGTGAAPCRFPTSRNPVRRAWRCRRSSIAPLRLPRRVRAAARAPPRAREPRLPGSLLCRCCTARVFLTPLASDAADAVLRLIRRRPGSRCCLRDDDLRGRHRLHRRRCMAKERTSRSSQDRGHDRPARPDCSTARALSAKAADRMMRAARRDRSRSAC